MVVLLDDECFEASLPHASSGPILPVIPAHMRGEQPMSPARNITIGKGANNQVQMVWHQAGRQDGKGHPLARLGNQRNESVIVGGFVEDWGAIVAAVDEVIAITGDRGSRCAWHNGSVSADMENEAADMSAFCAEMRNVPFVPRSRA